MNLTSPSASSLRRYGPAAILLAVVVLLPFARSAEAAIDIGAIAGIVLAWRQRGALAANAGVRLAAMLFLCYWLPALISAPDSVAPGRSWMSVATFLRFLPFAWFVVLALPATIPWPRFVGTVGLVVALWTLDAWIQALTGHGLAGVPEKERLSGIFGAGNLKFGPALAVLSPFALAAARARFGLRGLVAAFVLLLVPVLLAGSRAAWIMYALVVAVFLWREAGSFLRFVTWSAAGLALVALVGFVALRGSAAFDARVERTLGVLNGTEQAVDEAAAGRLQIWGTSLRMIAAHPINGVGVRAFRVAYPDYAQRGDKFLAEGCDGGACHAHNLVLEVLSETGTIGLALWIAGVIFALRAWRRADAAARSRAFVPGLALAVMVFPINGYFAFYSADWGLFFWWLLALYCAALTSKNWDAKLSD
ncbi:O-antigen ligase family protein [Rudaea sp.]|uniref:O-antigen ligase family protein n=1 Tax=Rudaea sp. TaxID=2136325 RepID=UPI002ED1A86E